MPAGGRRRAGSGGGRSSGGAWRDRRIRRRSIDLAAGWIRRRRICRRWPAAPELSAGDRGGHLPAPAESATLEAMGYPGGKSGAGVYQRLINEIPPHDVYVAGFAGRDAIAQHKRPAARNVLIDLDPSPLDWWAEYSAEAGGLGGAACRWELHNCDSLDWLRYSFGLTLHHQTADPTAADLAAVDRAARYRGWFVYLDPPYLMETRTSGPIYRHELGDAQHVELLEVARRLPCPTMICGYWSELYATALADWRVVEYFSVARSGERRQEFAWCNYPKPATLHDSRFVGGDKRKRENVRRRIARLSRTLAALPAHERQAVLDAVLEVAPVDRPALAATAGG